MSLSGRLSLMSVPEALQFLGPSRKSGVLELDSGLCRKELVIEQGAVAFCSAGWPKERLGHHLVARTSVTEADLDRAFRRQDRSRRKLGEILVDDGRLTPQSLQAVLRCKLEDSVYDLFTWKEGTFRFEERVAADVPAHLDLAWQDALMGGARRADEMPAIRRHVPDGATRFRTASFEAVLELGHGNRMRALADLAAAGLTADEICHSRHETDFEILGLLARLVRDGVLVVEEKAVEQGSSLDLGASLLLGDRLLGENRHVEALDVLGQAQRRHPGEADVGAALRSARERVRAGVEESLGGLDAVPVRYENGPVVEAPTARERVVLARVNGDWSASSIARICPLDELEALAVIDSLFRSGVLTMCLPRAVEEPADVVADLVTAPPAPTWQQRVLAEQAKREWEPGPGGRQAPSLAATAAKKGSDPFSR
jgi:hypothetical protein